MKDTKYKVLLIEDDEFDQIAFKQFVGSKRLPYNYTIIGSFSEAQSILAAEQFDVIIADYMLGDGTALNILDLVKKKDTPVIFITGAGSEEVAVKAWKGGAYDYLPKNHNFLEALPKAIEDALERKKMMKDARYKLLLIEDDKLDQMAFQRYVETEKLHYDYQIANSISDARHILESEEFDIIVSDYSLGDGTALDILNFVDYIPVVLVTGAGDEDVAIKAWKAGAYDYLPKDVDRKYLMALPKTIQNTIDRKRMEDALQRKQKNLEAIFDAVPVGMLIANENMVITRVNDAVRRMLHIDYPQIINKEVGEVLGCINSTNNEKGCGHNTACSRCLLKKTVKSVFNSGQSVHNVEIHPTLRIDNKETELWFRVSAEPVIIDGRKHMVIAVDDVTERKKAEHERRLAEEKYWTIFENSAVAITVGDDQEQLVSWNKFTEGLLGYDEKELHLRPIRTLYPPGEWERIRAFDVRQKGMQHHLETKIIKKDGSVIDVDISLSILKSPNGKTTGSIGVIRDITERRQAEEKLKETMEIKSQFISTVSHELRTPLTAIKEGVAIVLDRVVGEVNKEQERFLEIAKRNVDRLSALINDVLDFQKLEAGRMKPDICTNDIKQVISEVHEIMTLFADKHHVELVSEPVGYLPEAEFDKAAMIRVLTNLVSNAVKFTPENGRVSISARQQNEELAMSVSDTGMGIPREELSKIFERFHRVKRHGQEIQGTGLGLAIVHKIVMMHGGRIEVESEVDKGTTFTVFLPLKAKSLPECASEELDKVLEDVVAQS
jgi:PAS domain S-box-containing protein